MKHAFVTGGGGDIGAAIGLRATAAGYRVCLVDQDACGYNNKRLPCRVPSACNAT